MNPLLRAELFALATAAKAYYVVHGGSLESGSLEVQNFCVSVNYCLSPAPDTDEISDAALSGLLNVGIEIVAHDPAAASVTVGAALYRAREVLRQYKARTATNLYEALTHSHTAEYISADGVRYQVQEGVNFCVRRFVAGELPDSFAAINLGPALQIAAGRGWAIDANADEWTPIQRTPERVQATEGL